MDKEIKIEDEAREKTNGQNKQTDGGPKKTIHQAKETKTDKPEIKRRDASKLPTIYYHHFFVCMGQLRGSYVLCKHVSVPTTSHFSPPNMTTTTYRNSVATLPCALAASRPRAVLGTAARFNVDFPTLTASQSCVSGTLVPVGIFLMDVVSVW
jgi:hypothetical protein